jgi:hypothetical protein
MHVLRRMPLVERHRHLQILIFYVAVRVNRHPSDADVHQALGVFLMCFRDDARR